MNLVLKIKNLIQQHQISKQLSQFLIIGAASTLISYSTFFVMLRFFSWHYLLANLVGFIFSVGFSYYCNRRWTFKAKDSQKFRDYFLFYFCSLGIATISLKILVEFFGIIPEIASIINIAGMTGVNFLGLKFLVFKK